MCVSKKVKYRIQKSDRKKIVPDERHQGSSCGPTKVWIQVKSTGDLVEIDLNQVNTQFDSI